ncbi:hypothetical protein [Spirillospora sp. CA-128828]|uniref:hypothetical protein n=1 Tax=Spirillospora sp. CA-128828 TaxID=3240033 RepID=UPI003D8A0A8B
MIATVRARRPGGAQRRVRGASPAALRFRAGLRGIGNVAVRNRPPTLRRPPGMANTSKINI